MVGPVAHAVVGRNAYRGVTGEPGGFAFTDVDLYWCEDGPYARMLVRDNHRSDANGDPAGSFSDPGTNDAFADGAGWASTVVGATAYIATPAASSNPMVSSIRASSSSRRFCTKSIPTTAPPKRARS